ncbi:hypothetical protein QZH41_015452, partial [Actinostola sp. cb2023]
MKLMMAVKETSPAGHYIQGYPGYPVQPMADPLYGYFQQVAGARDYSGKMGFNEFKELWGALNQWKNTFMIHDRDRSGTVEPHELHQALATFGYRLSPAALNAIVKRYATNNRISFDDFVAACVRLRALT